jgi:hypothetical protein
MQIRQAVRQKIWLKVAITGATGSGKTYGAIGLAKGLTDDGRICVIDTENGSASFYAGESDDPGQWTFDTIVIESPFTPAKYEEAIFAAIDAGYKAIVVDSLTHVWAASGGVMDQKSKMDKSGRGNSFTNWNEFKQIHNRFVEALLQSKVHVIATMRSKMDYVLEKDESGRVTPRKVGLAPVMRDGIEYEFTTIFDVNYEHKTEALKDRTGLFVAKGFFQITEETGQQIADWLSGGVDVPEKTITVVSGIDKIGIYRQVVSLVKDGTLLQDEVVNSVKAFGKDKMIDLDDDSFMQVAISLGVA